MSTIVVFLLFATTVMGLGHVYVWRRLVRDVELPRGWRRGLSLLMLLLMASQPAVMLATRSVPREVLEPWAFAAFVWMGLLSTFFVLLLTVDLVRLSVRLWQKGQRDQVAEPGRRAAIRRMLAGGVAVTGATLGAGGVAHAMNFRLREVTIRLEKLPREFDGFRILQLSDIHVGPTIGRSFIEQMVDVANAQKPDLIAITGDLVDGSVQHLRHHTEPLRDLAAPAGVYFVTGNHDYYSGADDWVEEVTRLGIRVLRNDGTRIERKGASVFLAGVTDHQAERYGDAPNLPLALRDRRPDEEVILLAHQPASLHDAVKHDVGLQLSGHTHGGQLWPWTWAVHLVQPVVAGLAQFGRTQVYVNTGTGYWGPPMRVGTESEITLVTLRAAAPQLA